MGGLAIAQLALETAKVWGEFFCTVEGQATVKDWREGRIKLEANMDKAGQGIVKFFKGDLFKNAG